MIEMESFEPDETSFEKFKKNLFELPLGLKVAFVGLFFLFAISPFFFDTQTTLSSKQHAAENQPTPQVSRIAFPSDTPIPRTNALSHYNPSFDDPSESLSPWTIQTAPPATGSATLDGTRANFSSPPFSAKIIISSPSANAENFQLVSDSMALNGIYTIYFSAKASQANTVISIELTDTLNTKKADRDITLDTTWQHYSFQTTQLSGGLYNIRFNAGKSIGAIWIDDVEVK